MASMIPFEISYSDLQTFTDILTAHNLNIQGLRRIHVCNLIRRLLQHYNFHATEHLFQSMNTNPDLIQTCREMLCVSTEEFFRDASLWIQLKNIFKKIAVQPNMNILFARTSTGEELYSLLIFLQEMDLLKKTTVHATEICNNVLQQTKRAVYNVKTIQNTQKTYQELELSKPLLEYFDISGNMATVKSYLMNNCTFFIQDIQKVIPDNQAQYDLIWYRNQLIYWDKPTANQHLTQFVDSLKNGGYFILGYAENLDIYPVISNFETFSPEDKIYRKK